MVRISNALVGTLNVVSAIASLAVIGVSVYFHIHAATDCQRFLKLPLLVSGLVLFLVSVLGLFGSFCRLNCFLYLYLTFLFLCIIGLIGITVFMYVVTNEAAGKAISQQGFKEYRLGDYSNWVKNHVVHGEKWKDIKSCLMGADVCRSLEKHVDPTATDFYKRNLSPIQSGCCKPPSACGLEYKNATYWTTPKKGPAVLDPDCKTWSNDQSKLCFECDTCKAGFLGNVRAQWKELLILNACLVGFVILIYSMGCCASRNNRNRRMSNPYGNSPYPYR